jgi:RimJ/RimL family protein N-acetyltransferase
VTTRRLLDDTVVALRPVGPADADALVRFHDALSPESQRMRFFAIHPHLTTKEVHRFTHVDHRDREAFVVVVGSEILGIGRYDRLDDPTRAEVAFVTRDEYQGLGVATMLFDALVSAAQDGDITHFVAETLPENRKMLHFFGATGLETSRSSGRDSVEVTLCLPTNRSTNRNQEPRVPPTSQVYGGQRHDKRP